jgi:hypothetical protein
MTKFQHINAVIKETARIQEFASAHDYDDYITVYSALSKSLMHDVCQLLRHRSGGAWEVIPNNGQTITIKYCV